MLRETSTSSRKASVTDISRVSEEFTLALFFAKVREGRLHAPPLVQSISYALVLNGFCASVGFTFVIAILS
jgi:hypothetical protein